MKRLSVLFLTALLTAGTAFAEIDLSKLPSASAKTDVTFEKDIFPLFKDSCVRCHGAEKPKAGLRLDSLEAVLKGSKDGKVVAVGDSTKSGLVMAISRLDPETAMPPTRKGRGPGNRPPNAQNAGGQGTNQPAAGGPPRMQEPPAKPLTPEQVGLVRAWIDQGAK
jgi:hypothetical protein